jgi:2-keto-4-pentenoate hydratase/2-oxohepta-3-ene-1,7-dioic acid hydratase in catechol pathway
VERILLSLAAAVVVGAAPLSAQQPRPFKLGSFQTVGRTFVGAVLGETLVIDLETAHREVPPASAVTMPTDMKDLITRYESGVRTRIVEIVASVDLTSAFRPSWLYDVRSLKVLPPVYPTTMMNVAVNYAEHDIEMAAVRAGSPGQTLPSGGAALPGTESAPGIWERRADDPRWNPFMFLKAPAAIIADREAIRLPVGRTNIEWECELALVIGRTSNHVSIDQAADYIFGYTLHNDVSDRGGRGDTRYGSDWLITKNHDTFAPLGPFITPKEFIADVQNLSIRFSLNGEVLQEGNTRAMLHGVSELLSYGSNILTLRPGDVISLGTVPGSGSARTPPIFFKPGDLSVCTYEGVGTLTNPVVGADGRTTSP